MSFQINDLVKLSAKTLRSIDVSASKGWPSTADPGEGIITEIIPCGNFDLITVRFGDTIRTFNSANLIHSKDTYLDAMRAEHNGWYATKIL